jgi:hypothetical protein
MPPPRETMPSLPPPRAVAESIAPTAFDVEPLPQVAAPVGDVDVPELRAARGKARGFVAVCGLAVATLAFAAVWSHASPGVAAAAGAAMDTAAVATPAMVAREVTPFVPTLPTHPFRETIREEDPSGSAMAFESKLRHEELWSTRAMPRAHRVERRAGAVAEKAQPSVARAAEAPAANEPAPLNYETTVIGEFAGKL